MNLAIIIGLLLGNFGLLMLGIAIICIIINLLKQSNLSRSEIIFRWLVLLPVGLTAMYAFVMHAFFPNFTAQSIGWTNNPFQFEVAVANFGFGLISLLSFKASRGFRLATVIAVSCWLWGDAVGHTYQIIANHNLSIGNAGSWYWMDLLMPLLLIIFLPQEEKVVGRF